MTPLYSLASNKSIFSPDWVIKKAESVHVL